MNTEQGNAPETESEDKSVQETVEERKPEPKDQELTDADLEKVSGGRIAVQ